MGNESSVLFGLLLGLFMFRFSGVDRGGSRSLFDSVSVSFSGEEGMRRRGLSFSIICFFMGF